MTIAKALPRRILGSRKAGSAFSGLLALLLISAPPVTAQDLPEPAQNAVAGARVFGEAGCVECHAVRGLGGQTGPDLAEMERERSFHALAAALWNHLPQMADRIRRRGLEARLSPRKTGDLFAFLYSIDYFDEPGDPDVGRALFSEKRCVMCHQVQGVGGVVGPNLDLLGQYRSPIPVATAMWNHGPEMIAEMRRRGIERPSFRGSELVDLIAFLGSASRATPTESMHVLPGSAADGRELFRTKSCVRCHAVRGRGGDVGPDLAVPGLRRSLMDFATAMWNKAPRMTRTMETLGIEVPQLEASEMADIVAYLYSVRYFAESGSPSAGRRLLSSKGCAGCHRVDGQGPELAGRWYDSHAAVFSALWNHVRIEPEPDGWSELTAAEMADLIAYFLGPGR